MRIVVLCSLLFLVEGRFRYAHHELVHVGTEVTTHAKAQQASWTPPLDTAEDQVGYHNAVDSLAVWTACNIATNTALSSAKSGTIKSTNFSQTDGIVVEWTDGQVTKHQTCDSKLYTTEATATASGCSTRIPHTMVPTVPATLPGFADTHLHVVAEYGFGGRWFWGTALGNISEALPSCDGTTSHNAAGNLKLTDAINRIFSCSGSEIATHDTATEREGYPNFPMWPRWNDMGHHQAHINWIKKAHSDGLSLVLFSAVNNELLCEILDMIGVKPLHGNGNCDDQSAIEAQIHKMHEMVESNADWMEIALSASDARRIVAGGKLCVVIHVEVSDAFGEFPTNTTVKDWIVKKVDWLEALGVRSIQLLHEFNSQLGGAAAHIPMLQTGNNILALKEALHETKNRLLGSQSLVQLDVSDLPASMSAFPSMVWGAVTCPVRTMQLVNKMLFWLMQHESKRAARVKMEVSYENELQGKFNTLGLSDIGKDVARELMKRKFIVDTAHASRPSGEDVFTIATEEFNHYPLFVSHGGMFQYADGKVGDNDFSIDHDVLERVMKTGGMVGLRTTPETRQTSKFTKVENNCAGSVRSFLHELATIRSVGVDLSLASDFNGLARNLAPMFGFNNETCAENLIEANCESEFVEGVKPNTESDCATLNATRAQEQAAQGTRSQNGTMTDFDTKGFASVEFFGALKAQVEKLGETVPTGTDQFVRMWERIEDDNRAVITNTPQASHMKAWFECSGFW